MRKYYSFLGMALMVLMLSPISVNAQQTAPTMKFVNADGQQVNQLEVTLGEEFVQPRLTCDVPELLNFVSYRSTNENVATVSIDGVVTLVAAGYTSIAATFDGNDLYYPTRAIYSLIVNEAVTPDPGVQCPEAAFFMNGAEIKSLTLKAGESVSIPELLGATGMVYQLNRISTENQQVAQVGEDGLIYAFSAGSTTFVGYIINMGEDGQVLTCEYKFDIIVEAAAQKKDPELSIDPKEVNIELGETFTIPTIINPHNIEFTEMNSKWYTNWDSQVAEVDEQTGAVTIKGVGDETITFEFTGSDEYDFAILSYQLHVTTSGLLVGGVHVTNSNKNDVLGDNGSIVYDPVTHTLTMTNAELNGESLKLAPARAKKAEDIEAGILYTDREALTIVLVGNNAVYNFDAGIYSESAPVVILSSEAGYGTARISGNTVAIKAEALKLYQCDVLASGGVGIAVNELGVATGAHLIASGQGLAIQANNLIMAEDNNGEGIGILTEGVTFKQKSGFFNADGSMAAYVEIGKVIIPVPDNEVTTLDFTLTDPEGNESVIFSSSAQDKYNEETGQIELVSTLTDEQVETTIQTFFPGSTEWRESLPGSIIFDIPAGQGKITIEGSVSFGYTLKLKMGDQPVVTVTKGETGEIVVLYDTPATVHVVLYLQLDKSSSSAPARIAASANDEPVVGATIKSITITPKNAPTAIDVFEADNNGNKKIIRNGQMLIILQDGRIYNALGAEVK